MHVLHSFNREVCIINNGLIFFDIIDIRQIQVIAKRKQLLEENLNNAEQKIDNGEPKKKQVFIDMMLTTLFDGKSMSDEEISDEVSTFVFAVSIL